MSLKKIKGVLNTPEWITEYYDFAVHGGVKDVAIPLFDLMDNAIVHDVQVETVTAPVGATATVEIGLATTDTDGFLTQVGIASLPELTGELDKGALLLTTVVDAAKTSKPYKINSSTGKTVDLLIGTANLTAGKLAVKLLVSAGH